MKNPIKLLLISIVIMSILFSCDKKKDEKIIYGTPQFLHNQASFSDEEILAATYSDFKIPLNFYHEDLGDTSIYYVNTVSIDSLNNQWIQLATNSPEQAKYWSIISSANDTSEFTKGKEDGKFFEFIQQRSMNQTVKFRSHRENYLNRNNYDYMSNSNEIGIFTKINFTAFESKGLIDYLWFIDEHNNSSAKMLSSFTVNQQHAIEVHHYELLIVGGDFGIYDEIFLKNKIYSLNKMNGNITVSERIIKTIQGNYN